MPAHRIESLLAARLHLEPQLAGDRLVFVSNLGGHLSLYAMDEAGSVPEQLLPATIALQNPELVGGELYAVVPELDRVLVMIDADGDERYRPHLIPLDGGFPQPLAEPAFAETRAHLMDVDRDNLAAYFAVELLGEPLGRILRVDLRTEEVEQLGEGKWIPYPVTWTRDGSRVVAAEEYTVGDGILFESVDGGRRLLWGTPLEERTEGAEVPLSAFLSVEMTASEQGLLTVTGLFEDTYSLGYLPLEGGEVEPVAIDGAVHAGVGELERIERLGDTDRFLVRFNIDGCSWAYEGTFDERARRLQLGTVLCGQGELEGGELHGLRFDEDSGRFAAAFCTATQPTQLYVIDAQGLPRRLTRERPLGLDPALLSGGEDASYLSHDGLRVSARLYLPSEQLGYEGKRPVVLYVHGGPQGQERPNFAWFSMPLIQYLTLRGFAVFVPNARGSTGYGLDYTKRVDRDWGGQDRLDHVHAMTEVLPKDERLDVTRAAVVGRSYGGYMTLMLAGRHPELWSAACDMFGPYDLFSFMDRIPETWKPYFLIAVGDPQQDGEFLTERSPKTYVQDIACPLLVIQGANDPRVVEAESADVVEQLRSSGKDVEYLVFPDEGHDVLKLANRVRCYEAITDFFAERLRP
ncbi:MAG TPA: alpha/beta fold hydrolase [Gaiellaceae bacterium]|nr:alpha/beta fold hydrolase [Gaiellaceae bacterium]